MGDVAEEMPNGRDVSHRSRKVLLRWLGMPYIERAMGRGGLQEVASRCKVRVSHNFPSVGYPKLFLLMEVWGYI